MLLAKSTLPLEENLRNSIARMEQIPAVIDIARQTLDRVPKSILETAILQNKGAIHFYEKGIYDYAGESNQRELKDGFNLAEYHEAVLNEGSIPVKYLPELIRSRLVSKN